MRIGIAAILLTMVSGMSYNPFDRNIYIFGAIVGTPAVKCRAYGWG